ncbi:hypothetical protein M0R45_000128 [Rubus argutus]|uniref:RRM domain-containing protein n=1 Tax=Rubus argutus TaxID=59490 RepID=A0AAW1VLP7_RUBAR
MDSDQGKLFIGGISWETSEDKLKEYFSNYGDVLQTEKHTIDGRTVEAKRALSREEQQTSVRAGNPNSGRNAGSGGNVRTKKIFVDVVVMYDQNTGRPRGFGFISFDTEDAVDRVLHKTFHDLSGKQVEVKRALPKDANPGGGSRTMGGGQGGGSAAGGGYQGYGTSGGNPNAYDGRMDSNRYMQSQSTGVMALVMVAMEVTVVPILAMVVQLLLPMETLMPLMLVMVVVHQVLLEVHGAHKPLQDMVAMGYGNTAPWGVQSGSTATGSGGPGSAPAGQSPSAVAGYGAQGYGYGGYSGGDASYGNPSAYGAVGGRSGSVPNNSVGGPGGEQVSGGGYIGSGYGDSNGNAGYGNSGWRDPSQASANYGGQANGAHGGQVGYGGGYSSAQARQAQQQ